MGLVYCQFISQDRQKKEWNEEIYKQEQKDKQYVLWGRENAQQTAERISATFISGLSEEKARRLIGGSRGTVSIQRGVCRTNGLAGIWMKKNQGQQDLIGRCVGIYMWWVTFPGRNGLEPLHSHSWLVNNEELSGSTWCFTFKPCGIIFTNGSTQ